MKKRFLILSLLIFIFYSFNLLAINFPKKANKIEDFIPKGWKSIIIKNGDLNKDKIDDVVLVIQKDDPENFMPLFNAYEDITGSINANPMVILILFKDKNSQYNLIAKNEKDFIVSEGKAFSEEIEKLASPDRDGDLSKAITIKNNSLYIFTSMENYRGISSTEYILEYQNNNFELISLESNFNYDEALHVEKYSFSINFSTRKINIERLLIVKKTNEKGEKKTLKEADVKDKYVLDNMTENTKIEILNKYFYKKK